MNALGLAPTLPLGRDGGGGCAEVAGLVGVAVALHMIVDRTAYGALFLSPPVTSAVAVPVISAAGSEHTGGGSKQAGGAESSGPAASGSTPDYWSHVGKRLFSDPLCWLDVKPEQRAQYYSEKTPEPQEPFLRSDLPQRSQPSFMDEQQSQPSLTDEQQLQLDGPLFLIKHALKWLGSAWVCTPNPKTATDELVGVEPKTPTVAWDYVASTKAGSVGSSPSTGHASSTGSMHPAQDDSMRMSPVGVAGGRAEVASWGDGSSINRCDSFPTRRFPTRRFPPRSRSPWDWSGCRTLTQETCDATLPPSVRWSATV